MSAQSAMRGAGAGGGAVDRGDDRHRQGEQRLDQRIVMRLQRRADIVGQAAARREVGAAEKARPSPVSNSARAPEPGRSSIAVRSSLSIATLSAFRLSGRFSVIVVTPEEWPRRICSKSIANPVSRPSQKKGRCRAALTGEMLLPRRRRPAARRRGRSRRRPGGPCLVASSGSRSGRRSAGRSAARANGTNTTL